MSVDIEGLKSQVQQLASQVDVLLAIPQEQHTRISRDYQTWYSQVNLLTRAHLPERMAELSDLYFTEKPLYAGYRGISSYLKDGGNNRDLFEAELEQQRGILLAIPHTITLRVLEVTALVTSDLVSGELNEARLLLDHGFLRAAGAVAGVALEAHLKLLHKQGGLAYTDQDSIVPLAARLRTKGFITLGDEKKCIAMAETRNKCDHKKNSEPEEVEVLELIDDVDRFTKRVQIV